MVCWSFCGDNFLITHTHTRILYTHNPPPHTHTHTHTHTQRAEAKADWRLLECNDAASYLPPRYRSTKSLREIMNSLPWYTSEQCDRQELENGDGGSVGVLGGAGRGFITCCWLENKSSLHFEELLRSSDILLRVMPFSVETRAHVLMSNSSHCAFPALTFSSVSDMIFDSFAFKKVLKKSPQSKPTEAPPSHGKHCRWRARNASSAVL